MPKGRDTPETIMAVAQRYVDGEPRAAWATADKLMTSLARERAFAGGVLEAAEASDQNGLRRLFAQKAEVDEDNVTIADFDPDVYVRAVIELSGGGGTIHVCIDTEKKRCNGSGLSVTYTEANV